MAAATKTSTTRSARGGKHTTKRAPARTVNTRTKQSLTVIEGGQHPRVKSIQGERAKKATDAIANLEDDFLVCRTEFHRWETKGFYDTGLVTMFQMCERCGTERTARYRHNGRLEETHYRYPDGYQIKGYGPVPRFKIRAERFSRVVMYKTEDEMLAHVMGNGR